MSVLADTLKTKLDGEREQAAQAWKTLTDYREKEGDAKIALSKDLMEKAHELHAGYGTLAEAAKNTEQDYLKALAMDGSEAPSLKSLGEDAPEGSKGISRQEALSAQKRVYNMAEKAMDLLEDAESYKAFVGSMGKGGGAAQIGTLFALDEAVDRKTMKTLLTGVLEGQPIFLLPDMQPGYVEGFTRIANVMTGLITVGTTDNDKIEWVQQNAPTWAAAETPEAVDGDKAFGAAASSAPESALDFERKSTDVVEIKHFIPATKRQVADIGQLRTIADQELLYGIQQRLDSQIISGDGSGENLTGILNSDDIQTQDRGTDPAVEAIHRAFTKLLIAGYSNLSAVMHANDWQEIRLAKDEIGQYYFGPPNVAGSSQIWGYPVTLSQHITTGTALTGDFRRACTMWLRAGTSIVATDSHSDWFTKGIIAILASMRCAFAVTRPLGICEVTNL